MYKIILTISLFVSSNLLARDSHLIFNRESLKKNQSKKLLQRLNKSNGVQVVFSEFFESGTMPNGWVTIDVDGLTPHDDVSQFTDAWIVGSDPEFPSNFAAQSTSRYDPAGQADDWLITPLISLNQFTRLDWTAKSANEGSRDGYEVYISTTTQDLAGCTASNPVFSIEEENTDSNFHTVILYQLGFVNQDVYICFRNNSIDKQYLSIDHIQVVDQPEFDIGLDAVGIDSPRYHQFPQILGEKTIPLWAWIFNYGFSFGDSARATVEVFKDNELYSMENIDFFTTADIHIPNFDDFTATELGEYTIKYSVDFINNIDEQPTNNSFPTFPFTKISENILARDDGEQIDSFSIGENAQIGQKFIIDTAAKLEGVQFFHDNRECSQETNLCSLDGLQFTVDLFGMDSETGLPSELMATTENYNIPSGPYQNNQVDLYFIGGPVDLTPGSFILVVNEPEDLDSKDDLDVNAQIGLARTNFMNESSWINWPSNPNMDWQHLEDFDIHSTLMIRAIFQKIDGIFYSGFESENQ